MILRGRLIPPPFMVDLTSRQPQTLMLCTQEFATAEHFSRWESHAKTLDAYSLRYVIRDCQQAADAMKGWNPVREGYYLDQAATYGMELTRRNRELPAGLRHRI